MKEFTAHFDESYGSADAYSVAGYVATEEGWDGLIRAWRKLAKQEKFTVLHKNKLEHNFGEFAWPNLTENGRAIKKKRINSKACSIILRHVIAGFGASVQKSEWQSQVADGSKWGDMMGNSFYAAGVWVCLNMVGAWAESRPDVKMVRYVFEEGAEGRHEAEKMLRELHDDPYDRQRYRIHGYSFEGKDTVPLQAADFLAYESYRQIDNRVVDGVKMHKGRPIEPRGALRCLLRFDDPKYRNVHPLDLPVPHYGIWFGNETIAELLAGLNGLFADFPSEATLQSLVGEMTPESWRSFLDWYEATYSQDYNQTAGKLRAAAGRLGLGGSEPSVGP